MRAVLFVALAVAVLSTADALVITKYIYTNILFKVIMEKPRR